MIMLRLSNKFQGEYYRVPESYDDKEDVERTGGVAVDPDNPYAGDFGPFDGRVWLNTAQQGPLPKVAIEAAKVALEQKARPHLLRDEDFFEVPRRLKVALGKLTGAPPEDIILGNSTTYGLDLLANGMQWQRGDEVLVVDGDFSADVFPWLIMRNQGDRALHRSTIRRSRAAGTRPRDLPSNAAVLH